jgi:hypothetical protein
MKVLAQLRPDHSLTLSGVPNRRYAVSTSKRILGQDCNRAMHGRLLQVFLRQLGAQYHHRCASHRCTAACNMDFALAAKTKDFVVRHLLPRVLVSFSLYFLIRRNTKLTTTSVTGVSITRLIRTSPRSSATRKSEPAWSST